MKSYPDINVIINAKKNRLSCEWKAVATKRCNALIVDELLAKNDQRQMPTFARNTGFAWINRKKRYTI